MKTTLFDGDYPITSNLGSNYGGPNKSRPTHKGIDFGLPENTLLKAFADATLYHNFNSVAGNGIRLISGDYVVYYSHCSHVYVGNGQKVKKGQIIAASGNTGNSTGPHLHFELWKGGKVIDPLSLIIIKDEMSKQGYVITSWASPIRNDKGTEVDHAVAGHSYQYLDTREGVVKAFGKSKEFKIASNRWLHEADVTVISESDVLRNKLDQAYQEQLKLKAELQAQADRDQVLIDEYKQKISALEQEKIERENQAKELLNISLDAQVVIGAVVGELEARGIKAWWHQTVDKYVKSTFLRQLAKYTWPAWLVLFLSITVAWANTYQGDINIITGGIPAYLTVAAAIGQYLVTNYDKNKDGKVDFTDFQTELQSI
jgi:hypothetical protein